MTPKQQGWKLEKSLGSRFPHWDSSAVCSAWFLRAAPEGPALSGPRPPSPAVLPTTTQTSYLHADPRLGVRYEGSEIQALMKVLMYYGQLCSFTWNIDKGVLCPFN